MSESAEEAQQPGAQSGGPEWLDRLEQVDRHVASTVHKMVRDLQDLAAAAEAEAVGQLLAATARVDGETTQGGILTALLEEGRRFASRTAFFLTRPGEIRGWAGRGFSAVEGARLDYEDGSVWARIASRAGAVTLDADDSAAVCRSLGAPAGGEGVLVPFMLRGQLGGVLFADRLEGEGALGVASLQLLTHAAAQAVETTALRGGGVSPALRSSSDAAGDTSLWQPPEAEGTEPETPDAEAPASGTAAAVAGAAAAVAASAAAPAEVAVEPPPEEPRAGDAETVPAEREPTPEWATEAEVEEPPGVEELEEAEEDAEAEEVDFEMVTAEVEDDFQAVEDIEAELEPEPELEDTSDLWAVEDVTGEEEEEEEEEATFGVSEPAGEPTPAVVPPEVGQETVRLDIASIQGQAPAAPAEPSAEEETAKLPQWEIEETPAPSPEFELEPEDEEAPEPEYEIEPEPTEPVTAPMAAPDFSEDATIVNPPPGAASTPEPSPMAGGYVPPAPEAPATEVTPPGEGTPPPSSGFAAPPASKADAAGSTQVVPPTDIQGPGSAFGGSTGGAIPEGEQALHEEAKRLARLLVSEIKLYNEEIIEEGRRAGNIYDRLKDDIDRSRQMYEERIDPRLHESGADYFRQELVQRLAGGDERLLGY